MEDICYRDMQSGEEENVCALVTAVYSRGAGYPAASLYVSHDASGVTRAGKSIQYLSGNRPDCTAKLEIAHTIANR